nr:CDP-6-deoxy-L-threo-D-glycero-4-hexulose-3-dehydrase reductase-like [Nerophis lumbriciformis]
MSFSITNQRNDGSFEANDGESILDAALRDNRIYPYGCRSGACGACKCTLVSGEVDYGNYEEFALTDEDKAAGKLLICQATPLSDVVIDVDEVKAGANIRIKMLPCRIGKLERLAEDVIRLYLKLPKSQEFNYIAGQYIDIIMKDGQRRSFSIANQPAAAAEDGLELHVRHVPEGHFTPRVFDSMKERDLLRMEGPFGTYFLQTEVERPIVMVAGGTGFSPWQEKYPNLRYTPVLSDSSSDSWLGATGWVHQEVDAQYDELSEHDVYASGPPPGNHIITPLATDALGCGLSGRCIWLCYITG